MLPVKTFRIANSVTDVGLRPALLAEANRRRLKISVRNLKENEVEIIVTGFLDDVKDFYITACRLKPNSYCTPLEDYPYDVDWESSYQGFVAEEIAKFVENGKNVLNKLGEINSGLNSIDNKLDTMGSKLDSIDNKLDTMGSKLDSIDNKLDTMGSKLDSIDNKLDTMNKNLSSKLDNIGGILEKIEKKL